MEILKGSTLFITSLSHICDKSLSPGMFPTQLKFSEIRVKPLRKKRQNGHN